MAAGLGFKTFTTGEVLTAADTNGYLMQGINVFASTAARNAAITSPQEGQFAFTKDTNSLWYYDGAAWVASGATGDIEGVTAGIGISGGGTSGTVTVTNSMATAIDAKGDLVAGTGADAFSRLGVGANDTVLTADSAQATGLKWATASSGGMTSIASGSLPTGASTLTLSSISGSYIDLVLVILNWRSGSNGDYLNMRFNGVTSGTYFSNDSYASGQLTTTATSMRFTRGCNSTTNAGQITVDIPNYASTVGKFIASNGFNNDSATSGNSNQSSYVAGTHTTTAITSLTIFSNDASNFAAGTYILYGVK
jgi:hypothetical protein